MIRIFYEKTISHSFCWVPEISRWHVNPLTSKIRRLVRDQQVGVCEKVGGFHLGICKDFEDLSDWCLLYGFYPRPMFRLSVWKHLRKTFLQPCEYNGPQRDGGSTLQSLLPWMIFWIAMKFCQYCMSSVSSLHTLLLAFTSAVSATQHGSCDQPCKTPQEHVALWPKKCVLKDNDLVGKCPIDKLFTARCTELNPTSSQASQSFLWAVLPHQRWRNSHALSLS